MQRDLIGLHPTGHQFGAEQLAVAGESVEADGLHALEQHRLGLGEPDGVDLEPHRVEEARDAVGRIDRYSTGREGGGQRRVPRRSVRPERFAGLGRCGDRDEPRGFGGAGAGRRREEPLGGREAVRSGEAIVPGPAGGAPGDRGRARELEPGEPALELGDGAGDPDEPVIAHRRDVSRDRGRPWWRARSRSRSRSVRGIRLERRQGARPSRREPRECGLGVGQRPTGRLGGQPFGR